MSSELMKPCRLMIDGDAEGAWNMALDEALAESADFALRMYRWKPATLSLGYFQRCDDRASHQASRDCPIVRRASGGGAIVHDRELTYTLVAPIDDIVARHPRQLYLTVHNSLIEALNLCGIAATQNEESPQPSADGEPFLCFQRHAVGDVLIRGHKVAGSAQRRWRGAVLEHGSILLAASPAAPELPGINDLTSRSLDVADLRESWLGALARSFRFQWLPGEATAEEVATAHRLVAEKYANDTWTQRR